MTLKRQLLGWAIAWCTVAVYVAVSASKVSPAAVGLPLAEAPAPLLTGSLGRACAELKATLLEVASQIARLALYLAAAWRHRRLQGRVSREQLVLAERMYAAGHGDAQLRRSIADVDAKIQNSL